MFVYGQQPERTIITEPPISVSLEPGQQSVMFHCIAISDASTPEIEYSWLYDGELLPNDYRDPWWEVLSNSSLLLHVARVTTDTWHVFGEYTCVASNGYSRDMASAFLNPPMVASSTPLVGDELSSSLAQNVWHFLFPFLACFITKIQNG